jgi:uncharacterized protein
MNTPASQPKILLISNTFSESKGQCDCDCDCACADNDCACTNAQPHIAGRWQRGFDPADLYTSAPIAQASLPDGERLALSPLTSVEALLNRAAGDVLNHFATPRPLETAATALSGIFPQSAQQTAHKLVELGLLIPANRLAYPVKSQAHTLTAWLHLTDRCNLRCAYCYLPHEARDMSLETGRAALKATFCSAAGHGFKQVKVKYAGGEPLLRFAMLKELHRFGQQLAQEHHLGLQGVVLSNGLRLTPAIISDLKSLHLRLAISLDETGSENPQRTDSSGDASASRAQSAVLLALAHGLTPDISITVSGRSLGQLPELLEWVLAHQLPFTLNFYRQNDLSMAQRDLSFEQDQFIQGILAAYRVVEQHLPTHSLLSALTDRANLSAPRARTCGVGQNYLVFDPQGAVAKCQMQLGESFSNAQRPDPLGDIRAEPRGLQNPPLTEKTACQACTWSPWCTGGCPLAAKRTSGQYQSASPFCGIYQALLPEALRLEGLRLKRIGSSN